LAGVLTGIYIDKIVHYDEPVLPADRRIFNAARNIAGAYLASRLAGSPLDVLLEQEGLIVQGAMSIAKVRTGTMRVSFWAEPAAGVAPHKVVDAAQAYLRQLPTAAQSPEILDRLKLRLANGRELLRQQPDKTAEALVAWFSGHETYAYWKVRNAAYSLVTPEHVKAVLDIMAKPGREVVGILQPPAGTPAEPAASPPPDPDAAAVKQP
jgi:predicted Zn-dependent peptidase